MPSTADPAPPAGASATVTGAHPIGDGRELDRAAAPITEAGAARFPRAAAATITRMVARAIPRAAAGTRVAVPARGQQGRGPARFAERPGPPATPAIPARACRRRARPGTGGPAIPARRARCHGVTGHRIPRQHVHDWTVGAPQA
ncbi:hypothetical protein [Actinoplanes teichomyceticus]|uniref:hypothetical protein n=1 Tax=Actinoplanes teichomyceticus TaxID=1867 RepID=UPI0013DE61EA|nr:hypothetical protein [Actinoplanes teichomyceticus]GIF10063.1 hypothetical protein Ate01nite_00950 [Actinoplanes teichomyceticus]